MEKKMVNIEEKVKKEEVKLEAIRYAKIIAPISAMLMFLVAAYFGEIIAVCTVLLLILGYSFCSNIIAKKNPELAGTKENPNKMDYAFILCLVSTSCGFAANFVSGIAAVRIIAFLVAPVTTLIALFIVEKDINAKIAKLKKESSL